MALSFILKQMSLSLDKKTSLYQVFYRLLTFWPCAMKSMNSTLIASKNTIAINFFVNCCTSGCVFKESDKGCSQVMESTFLCKIIHTGLVIHDYIFPKAHISSTILFQDLKRNVDALEFVFFSQMFQDLTKQFHRPSWTSKFHSHMKFALLINLNEI